MSSVSLSWITVKRSSQNTLISPKKIIQQNKILKDIRKSLVKKVMELMEETTEDKYNYKFYTLVIKMLEAGNDIRLSLKDLEHELNQIQKNRRHSRKQLNESFNLSDTSSYNRKSGRDQNWKWNRSREMLNCLEIDNRTLRVY